MRTAVHIFIAPMRTAVRWAARGGGRVVREAKAGPPAARAALAAALAAPAGPDWRAGSDRHGRAPALLCTACSDSAQRAHDGATTAAPRRGRSLPSLSVPLTPQPNTNQATRSFSATCTQTHHRVVAGATFGAPARTSAPSSSASCSCCYLASSYSSTLTTSVRLMPRTRERHAIVTMQVICHLTLAPLAAAWQKTLAIWRAMFVRRV